MKRIVSILLVLVLLIGMVPVTVSAASKAAITSQPKSVVAAKGATAKVTLKATGDGLSYTWYYKDAESSGILKLLRDSWVWYRFAAATVFSCNQTAETDLLFAGLMVTVHG